jgi:hypothetical protein
MVREGHRTSLVRLRNGDVIKRKNKDIVGEEDGD